MRVWQASHEAIDQQPASLTTASSRLRSRYIVPHESRSGADHPDRAALGPQGHRGLVGLDVGLHSDLHAGLVA